MYFLIWRPQKGEQIFLQTSHGLHTAFIHSELEMPSKFPVRLSGKGDTVCRPRLEIVTCY